MPIFDSAARERHRVFDQMQAATTVAITEAVQADLIGPEEGQRSITILEESFVPNIRHGRALMPKNRRGLPGTAMIFEVDPNERPLDIGDVIRDIPERDIEAMAVTFGAPAEEVRPIMNGLVAAGDQEAFLALDGVAAATYTQPRGLKNETMYRVATCRSVIAYSTEFSDHPAIVAHETSHVDTGRVLARYIPEIYMPERRRERNTATERCAYYGEHAVQQIVSPHSFPDHRELAEKIAGLSFADARKLLAMELKPWIDRTDQEQQILASVLGLTLSLACGVTYKDEVPQEPEMRAYEYFGLV